MLKRAPLKRDAAQRGVDDLPVCRVAQPVVVAIHVYDRHGEHGDDVLKVIIWQVATPDDQVDLPVQITNL